MHNWPQDMGKICSFHLPYQQQRLKDCSNLEIDCPVHLSAYSDNITLVIKKQLRVYFIT